MKKIPADEIKKIELNLLTEFHDICISNDFKYSLCGGTLLGAIRHKGFIPWDDDIDVLMPMPDYKRFLRYCKTHNVPFGLIFHGNEPGYFDGLAKIYDRNTIIVDEIADYQKIGLGLHIDICPINGLGNTYKEAVRRYKCSVIERELLNAKNWRKYSKSKTRPSYHEPIRMVFYLISRFVNGGYLIKRINRKYSGINYEESKFGGCVYGSYRSKEIMSLDIFNHYILLPFENSEFYCIKEYDQYLSNIYGDYMKLPPEKKRITHHYFTAYYK